MTQMNPLDKFMLRKFHVSLCQSKCIFPWDLEEAVSFFPYVLSPYVRPLDE